MARRSFHFTSESVSEGHPDKVCDRISDAIVDAHIAALPEARVACETLATTNRVIIAGEHRGADTVTNEIIERVTREAIRDIGYTQNGFHWQSVEIENLMHGQSSDIARGVDGNASKPEGAGDQGIMFGYACRETPELMPAPIQYAHAILRLLAEARHSGREPALGPDSKSQVTIAYEDGVPTKVDAIVLSTQHLDETLTSGDIQTLVAPYVRQALPEGWITNETVWHVNPTGKFVTGGPDSDTGLTGRKIIVDTYGGAALHGGGAFSGKDPTKVDRSAAYAARYLAKNVVAGGFADRCTIQLSYAIGVAQPLSIYVNTHGTSAVSEQAIEAALGKVMDLSPKGIRDHLQMNRPIYARTAAYGHFGREPDAEGCFSWEKTDLTGAIDAAL